VRISAAIWCAVCLLSLSSAAHWCCPRSRGLVRRDFTAIAPNQLWVTDLTSVPTWAGVAYVCFIVDAFSRTIVGWRVASHMRTTMILDAIEMARWSRGTKLTGLRCHSDAGSRGGSRQSEKQRCVPSSRDGTHLHFRKDRRSRSANGLELGPVPLAAGEASPGSDRC